MKKVTEFIDNYLPKYAALAGVDKEKFKIDPKWAQRGSRGSKHWLKHPLRNVPKEDPGYVFLGSGRFARIMLPPPPRKPSPKEKEEVVEMLTDLFGRMVGAKDLYG